MCETTNMIFHAIAAAMLRTTGKEMHRDDIQLPCGENPD
jgi:hypothetical protein